MLGPELSGPLLPDWGGYPSGMSKNDFILWQRYQPLIQNSYLLFYFNVRIGEAILMQPDLEEDMLKLVEAISRRRIDVVGEATNHWAIIELRAHAGPGALGSILAYKSLWEMEPPDPRPVKMVIVSDFFDINLTRIAPLYNIETVQV